MPAPDTQQDLENQQPLDCVKAEGLYTEPEEDYAKRLITPLT